AELDFAAPTADKDECLRNASRPHDRRLQWLVQALRAGATVDEVHDATGVDPWFLDQLLWLVETAASLRSADGLDEATLRQTKRLGFSDLQIAAIRGDVTEDDIRRLRHALGV